VAAEEGKKPKIRGHAAVFDKKSEDLGGFREIVKPGAFTRTIAQGADVRALWNHDPNYVLGRTKSGTLRLEEDKRGLAVEIDPPDAQWAGDLLRSIDRGDVDQMSFAFRAVKQTWDDSDPKNIIRSLDEVQLFDVSPVTYPAYPQTSVSVREHMKAINPDAGVPSHSEPIAADPRYMETLKAKHAFYGKDINQEEL
jgi:HK97 family phage prohead protease